MERWGQYVTVFLRLALGITFLAAVADRFGLWGAPGQPGVAWGDFGHFLAYTAKLNFFLPPALIPLVGGLATMAETVLGVSLIVGLYTRASALASGVLLLLFALAMAVSLGVKAPLDASVFSASAGALLLATCPAYPWSLDRWLKRGARQSQERASYSRTAV
jgi:uncharacterized membrane protein YphA (DoxX/SURF4 family)